MGEIRLYRDIYKITNGVSYSLVSAYGLTANTYNLTGNVFVENATVMLESVGKYYAILNPLLYSFDNIYELRWSIYYTSSAVLKTLINRFKFQPYNIISGFDSGIEINNSQLIEYELENNEELIIAEFNDDIQINTDQYVEYQLENNDEITIIVNQNE